MIVSKERKMKQYVPYFRALRLSYLLGNQKQDFSPIRYGNVPQYRLLVNGCTSFIGTLLEQIKWVSCVAGPEMHRLDLHYFFFKCVMSTILLRKYQTYRIKSDSPVFVLRAFKQNGVFVTLI